MKHSAKVLWCLLYAYEFLAMKSINGKNYSWLPEIFPPLCSLLKQKVVRKAENFQHADSARWWMCRISCTDSEMIAETFSFLSRPKCLFNTNWGWTMPDVDAGSEAEALHHSGDSGDMKLYDTVAINYRACGKVHAPLADDATWKKRSRKKLWPSEKADSDKASSCWSSSDANIAC